MKKNWCTFLKISAKALIALVILAVVAVYAGVNDALHPTRRICKPFWITLATTKRLLDFFETWLPQK